MSRYVWWASVLVGTVLAVVLARLFPGTPWLFLARAAVATVLLSLLCHLLAGPPGLRIAADPPVGLHGEEVGIGLTFRTRVPGCVRLDVRGFGRTFSARQWVGPGMSSATLVLDRLPRGEHWIQARMTYEDPFGLLARRRTDGARLRLAVRPRTVDVDPRGLLALAQSLSAGARRVEGAREPAGARPYLPGDRLSHIHWPQTARTGAVQVRETWTRGLASFRIVLDTDPASYRRAEAFEVAVSVAGSLALSALARGGQIAFEAGGDRVPEREASPSLIIGILTRVALGSRPFSGEGGRGVAIVVTGGRGDVTAGGETVAIAVESTPRPEILSVPSLSALVHLGSRERWAAR